MSEHKPSGEKPPRHDRVESPNSLPSQWTATERKRRLLHDSGAQLIIRRAAPPTRPTGTDHVADDTHELAVQPSHSETIWPVCQGRREPLCERAMTLARARPDADFQDDDLAPGHSFSGGRL
jgi:hypothetical protein